jgi:hypothetical protein
MARIVRLGPRRPKRPARFGEEHAHFEGSTGDAFAALSSIAGTLEPLNDALRSLTPLQKGMAFQIVLAVLGKTIASYQPEDGLDHSACFVAEFMRGWETGIQPSEPEEECPF